MTELKPCPFCGKKPRIIKHEFYGCRDTFGIKCSCGSEGYQFWETAQKATEEWNRRAYE